MLVIDEVGPLMVPVVALVREMRRDRWAVWWSGRSGGKDEGSSGLDHCRRLGW
ncbi:glycylpeptide N-tetradecanoyltransferase 1 [Iris pallida]|uniref:Glycylpeptide N-tetradecanoyltransferase 1 n=1 Tax=Iris pallida TaxID=29817 RepID=A0AAX6DV49_IRIPA|nr:glycylpeptide N-tetradecanoyltransferase 1 [Iris pallida]